MATPAKEATVEELTRIFSTAHGIYLTDFLGLNVESLADLRGRLREKSASYRVVKNTLARMAVERAGFSELKEALQGPTGLAYTLEDGTLPAQVLTDFAKRQDRFKLKGALVDGHLFSPSDVVELAALPPRSELLAKTIGTMQAPLSGLVGCLSGLLSSLVGTLQALAEQRQQTGGDADPTS